MQNIKELINKYTKGDIKALRNQKRKDEIANILRNRKPGQIREANKAAKQAKRNWTQADMAFRMGLGNGVYKRKTPRPAQTKKRVEKTMVNAYAIIENNWGDDIPMCLLVLYVLGEVPHEM